MADASAHSPTSPLRIQKRKHAEANEKPVARYWGNKEIATLCSRFVVHLLRCKDGPLPIEVTVPGAPRPRLAEFIAYVLSRARLHSCVTFHALYLILQLRIRFPDMSAHDGHRLFLAAFMLAAKYLNDDSYGINSWLKVAMSIFTAGSVKLMERELLGHLDWHLFVIPSELEDFEAAVRLHFKGPGPYPPYTLLAPPRPPTTPSNGQTAGTTPPPSVAGPSLQSPSTALSWQPPSTSHSKPMPPPAPVPVPIGVPSASYVHQTPPSPDTPESSTSTSTSPASARSPFTPPGPEDHSIRLAISEAMATNINAPATVSYPPGRSSAHVYPSAAPNVPAHLANVPDESMAGRFFARAIPYVW